MMQNIADWQDALDDWARKNLPSESAGCITSWSDHIAEFICARVNAPAQAVPAPVAWRLTDGEGDYEYLTEEPSDQSRAWSRRYGREWEPLYASPVSSSPSEPAQLMWQPFETAPKDGTWIIARCNDHSRMFRISWGRAQNGDMCWCTSESIISYGDGLFSPNGGWTPCPSSQLPSTPSEPAKAAPDRLPTHGNLLSDINKAAHSAGTGAWVRDVLQRAHRAIRLSAPLSSTVLSPAAPKPVSFLEAMNIVERGFDTWKDKPHNAKWYSRIDGTPIPNDLKVNIAEAICHSTVTSTHLGSPDA